MKKTRTIVRAIHPSGLPGELKPIGGSNSDSWNNLLASQVVASLWTKHSDEEQKREQREGTISALMAIGPRDELEGMMAAQLIAAHNAAMEGYRRAMLPEQTAEGRRENLSQANKLSRTYTILLEALNRNRGKGHRWLMADTECMAGFHLALLKETRTLSRMGAIAPRQLLAGSRFPA